MSKWKHAGQRGHSDIISVEIICGLNKIVARSLVGLLPILMFVIKMLAQKLPVQ